MRTIFKKIAFSLAGLTVAGGIVWACADDGLFVDSNSSFTPELVQDSSYRSLFYDPYNPFYNIGFLTDLSNTFTESVSEDWKTYLDGKVSSDFQNKLLFADTTSVAELNVYIQKNILPKKWKSLDISQKKVKAFADFLALALKVDKVAAVDFSPWRYDADTSHKYVSSGLVNSLHAAYLNTKSEAFIQNRYWFQWLKATFYSNDKSSYIKDFFATSEKQPKNELYYRALNYLAGVYKDAGKIAESNYYYSVVFDKCPPLRTQTAKDFHPLSNEDYSKTLQLAKTNSEKAAIWAIIGYHDDPIRALKEIYQLVPNSPHMGFLLTRYINRIESVSFENNLSYPYNYSVGNSKFSEKDSTNKYIQNADFTWLRKVADEHKTAEPGLWYLGVGYLAMIQNQSNLASKEFALAKDYDSKDELYKKEIRLFSLLNQVYNLKEINVEEEKKLTPELHWFVDYMQNKYVDHYYTMANYKSNERFSYAYSKVRKKLSDLYIKNGDVIKAELLFPTDNFYLKDKNIEDLKVFLGNNSLSDYDKIWANSYRYNLDDIIKSQAILATMRQDLNAAVKYANTISDKDTSTLFANPFNGYIFDNHDWEFTQPQKIKYTTKSFILKLALIKSERDKRNSYTDALLFANALYNISYYGNARMFSGSSSIISGMSFSSADFNHNFNREYYYNAQYALAAYKRALELATNREDKAKMTYFLAKCERNSYYTNAFFLNPNWNSWSQENQVVIKDWNSFKTLRNEYKDTKYYQEVLKECGYFYN